MAFDSIRKRLLGNEENQNSLIWITEIASGFMSLQKRLTHHNQVKIYFDIHRRQTHSQDQSAISRMNDNFP